MIYKKTTLIALATLFTLVAQSSFAQQTEPASILWTTDWSLNGKYIAVGGDLDTLHIYAAKDLKRYKSYPIQRTTTRVKWHPTKNILAISTQVSGDKARILNLDTDQTIILEGISPDGARGLDWNYSGEYLAVGDNDGKTSIFDASGKFIRSIQQDNTKSITSMDWHPSQNILVTVGDKIRMYDLNGNLLKSIQHRPEDVLLLSVSWHNSGDFFVTGDYGDTQNNYKPLLQFWSNKGDLLKSIEKSIGEYRNLSWNAQGTRLASASDALRIWDKNGTLLHEGKSEDYLWGVSWNKSGNRIITSSLTQHIVLWDGKAREQKRKS